MERTPIQWATAPLRQYARFEGRARRAEYWWFALFYFVVLIAAFVIDLALGTATGGFGILYALTALALMLPSLAVSVRRLHDLGKTGWLVLIALIPLVGGIILLVWFCSDGTAGPNRFGGDPKGRGVTSV